MNPVSLLFLLSLFMFLILLVIPPMFGIDLRRYFNSTYDDDWAPTIFVLLIGSIFWPILLFVAVIVSPIYFSIKLNNKMLDWHKSRKTGQKNKIRVSAPTKQKDNHLVDAEQEVEQFLKENSR